MKNKVELILLISLFSIGLSLESINAQEQPESLTSRPSLNGLETSDYKRVKIGIEQLNGAAKIIGLTEERIMERGTPLNNSIGTVGAKWHRDLGPK